MTLSQWYQDKKQPLLILAAAAAAIAVLAAAFAIFGGDEYEPDGPDLGAARVSCERAVAERLTNPSTADFESPAEQTATLVRGRLTGENKLGGKVTMEYACVMSGATPTSVTVDER